MHFKLLILIPVTLILGIIVGSSVLELLTPTSVSDITTEAIDALREEGIVAESPLDFKVVFVGDIMLGRHVEYLMRENGHQYPFANVEPMFSSSTYVVGNFESAMSPSHIQTPSGGFTFSVDSTFIPALASSGITHVSLANNHALDYGATGYNNAKEQLTSRGISWFGHSSVISTSSISYLQKEDVTIGIIGIHTLFVAPDPLILKEKLNQMSAQSDIQIAYIHWGDEYKPLHNDAQAELARLLVTYGIDAIVGHHPHVTQDIDSIEGVPVFYSLGNFIFDQYFSKEVQTGYIVELGIFDTNLVFNLKPITAVGTRSQPRLMDEAESQDFLHNLAEISHPDYLDYIKQGKLIIPFDLAKS